MEIYYPDYFHKFSCIAAQCPDSCCKEWSVDIDSDTAAFYRQLPGELGQRLRQALQDTDNGTIMVIKNGRCPMWRQDGLCQIQAELDHEALCKVCREYPRLQHDFGSFIEYGLELSCPEAARLILTGAPWNWAKQTAQSDTNNDDDDEALEILRRSRGMFIQFLHETSLDFPQILTVLLLYAHDVQAELDGGTTAVLEPETYLQEAANFSATGNIRALQDFCLELEILTPRWKALLKAPAVSPQWDYRHKALLEYFIYRYWLQAIADYDLLCRAKFAIAACLLIGHLDGNLIANAQLFSKEIENDPENIEAFFDGAYTNSALTDLFLLGLLTN